MNTSLYKNSGFLLIILYLGLSVYLLPMFPHGGSDNELSRWATAASLVENGTFEISGMTPLIGNNVDTARIGDNLYSNKAPGTAIMAAPVYAFTRLFIGPPTAGNIRISWFAMRFVLSTFPLLFLAFWLFRNGADTFSIAALLFATPLMLFGNLFFSHVFAAVLIYFVFRLLFDSEEFSIRRLICAGVLSGIAVFSEFMALIPILVFGIGLFFTDTENRVRNCLLFILGGLPFAVLLLIYNNALFGSPFSMSYGYETYGEWAAVANRGFYGFSFPTPVTIFTLLFSPSRGLFFYSPILILTVAAIWSAFRKGGIRNRVLFLAVAISIILLCGRGAVHGGWGFGARYLVFILPLLLDPLFRPKPEAPRGSWHSPLLVVSVLLCAVPAFTFPFAPPEFVFPHNSFWGRLLVEEQWFTPNLLNAFGIPNNIWTTFPAIAVVAGVIFIIWKSGVNSSRMGAGIAASFLLVGVYVFGPDLEGTRTNKLRRATIAERFFKPSERLEVFRKQSMEKSAWKDIQNINGVEWSVADTRAYGPDDFPYQEPRPAPEAPSARMKKLEKLNQSGRTSDAVAFLLTAKRDFPQFRCEFGSNLAVIYYESGKKEEALAELKDISTLANKGSRPQCLRSQFLLMSLYLERGQVSEAEIAARQFLENSAESDDAEITRFRQQVLQMGKTKE